MASIEPASGTQASSTKLSGYAPVALAFIVVVVGLGLAAAPSLIGFSSSSTSIVNGSWTRALEKHYDEAFPIRIYSVNIWTAAQLLLFGEGKIGVVVGEDGWLYTNEEFAVTPDWQADLAANLHYINWARGELARAGVPLLIAIVPEKAKIYPEHIGNNRQAAVHHGLTQRLTEDPQAQSTPMIDLAPVLSAARADGLSFFRTDTHWTPNGAERAAGAIAERLKALALTDPAAQPALYRVTRDAETLHRGDLLSFLPLEPLFPSLLPPPENIVRAHTEAPAAVASGDSLFEDSKLPAVALVGTSYSANPAWNFAGFVEAALGESVANYSKEGVGPFVTMSEYLLGEDFKAHKPRVLIWEIPERVLPAPAGIELFKLPPEARLKPHKAD